MSYRTYVERAIAIAPQIEEQTGLKFVTPPKVEVRTAEQVRGYVERQLNDSLARDDLASLEAAYKRFALIPDSVDLRALLGRLLAQQIVGYYDPPSKTLYIVEGADSAAAETTLRHELVHALQDQHLDVDSALRIAGQSDRAIAAQSALEGEATFAQFASLGIALRGPGAWERIRGQIRDNMDRTPAIADAPFVVRETLLFPYLSGAEFARRLADRGSGDSLLTRLPQSTEQVLHADAYFGRNGGPPDVPRTVVLPTPNGGTIVRQNTLGEFATRLLLFHHLQELDEAARAALGWGGDRFAVIRTPQGDAFAWVTVWDTAEDAAAFYDALGSVIPKRYPDAAVVSSDATPGGGRRYTADRSRALVLQPGEVGGLSAVLYVDAPAGSSRSLIDLAKVTLRE